MLSCRADHTYTFSSCIHAFFCNETLRLLSRKGEFISLFFNLDLDVWQVLAKEKLENLIETEAWQVLENWGSSCLAILGNSYYHQVNEPPLAFGGWVTQHPATTINPEEAIHHQAYEWGHQPPTKSPTIQPSPQKMGELYQHLTDQRRAILLKPSPKHQLMLQWERKKKKKIVSFSH